jgi:hypothetical protein
LIETLGRESIVVLIESMEHIDECSLVFGDYLIRW